MKQFWNTFIAVCWIFGHHDEPFATFNGIIYTWKCLMCGRLKEYER